MFDIICLILIGVCGGIMLCLPLALYWIEEQLKKTDVAWQSIVNKAHEDWTNFYEYEANRWQQYINDLAEKPYTDVDAWKAKKSKDRAN